MIDVENKVAFITGGDSGIGLGIARAFLDAGMKVVIGYRTIKHLDEAMKHLACAGNRIDSIHIDVTDRSGMERAAEETVRVFGKVNVLVNNAGVAMDGPLISATYEDWDWIMSVNLDGVFNGIRAFLPRIKAHDESGHIVTTSSINGLFVPSGLSIYSASKAAVVSVMESLHEELANSNIGVSVYCPGLVNTRIESSNRNRPRNSTDSETDADLVKINQSVKRPFVLGMDPLEAGGFVLRGVRRGDLYIFSHPEYEQGIRDRHEALISSIPQDLHPPGTRLAAEQLRNPIYTAERDRIRCSKRIESQQGN